MTAFTHVSLSSSSSSAAAASALDGFGSCRLAGSWALSATLTRISEPHACLCVVDYVEPVVDVVLSVDFDVLLLAHVRAQRDFVSERLAAVEALERVELALDMCA